MGCGDETTARIFFYSYVLIMSMIFIKVFIAVVLQNFQETVQKDSKFLSSELSDNFREVWSNFDPNVRYIFEIKYFAIGDKLYKKVELFKIFAEPR